MKQSKADYFLKKLLKRKETNNIQYLNPQAIELLIEDPDFDSFSLNLKRFILEQQNLVDKDLKYQSY